MPPAPEFNIDDVVYLKSSAAIGRLEAYKVSGIKQLQDTRWLFRIDIAKKPPNQQLIGDTYDSRIVEGSILYSIEELVGVCDAMGLIVSSLESRISAMEARVIECDEELSAISLPSGDPKFSIGDEVLFDASARLGFLEKSIITQIFVKQTQPGSAKRRYNYRLDLKTSSADKIIFRESELLTFCEATVKALGYLNQRLAEAIDQRAQVCGVIT